MVRSTKFTERLYAEIPLPVWYAAVGLPIANSDGCVRRAAEKRMKALVGFDGVAQRLTEHGVESVDLVINDCLHSRSLS